MADTASKGSIKVKLEYPVQSEGATLSEVTVRRPKGRDMRALPKGSDVSMEEMWPFYGLLCQIPDNAFDEMDAGDIAAIGEVVTNFLSRKPTKGKK